MLFRSAKKRIPIRILTRVDIVSRKKVSSLLELNTRLGWDAFQIRHCEQPIRAFLIDEQRVIMKETLSPEQHRELEEKVYMYYILQDPEWVSWLAKVFWQLWNQSIDAQTRLKALQEIHD